MFSSPTTDLSPPAAGPSTSADSSDILSDNSRMKKPVIISFNHLPCQSSRSALILDRFSIHCTVLYCSNDILLSSTKVLGRSFFDFVTSRTVHNVRSSIDVIKAWGVNERGQPSDGGFGFSKFMLLPAGRDSRYYSSGFFRPSFAVFLIFDIISRVEDAQDTPLSGQRERLHSRGPPSKRHSHHSLSSGMSSRPRARTPLSLTSPSTPGHEVPVDAIFSGHSDGLLLILRATS